MSKTGFEHNLYRGTAGSAATTKMTNFIDLNCDDARTEIEDTTHASGGYKSYRPGLRDLPVTFDMLKDDADADYTALQTAYEAGTPLSFAITNGSGKGIVADYYIIEFKKSLPIDDKATVSVSLKITTSSRTPVTLTTEPTTSGQQ